MAHRTTHYLRIGSRRVLHAAVSLNRLPAASVAATMSDEQETESAYAWYTADARQEVLELLKAFLLHTIQEGKLGDLSLLGQEQGALVSLDLHFRTLPQRTWFLCPQVRRLNSFSCCRPSDRTVADSYAERFASLPRDSQAVTSFDLGFVLFC
eukprot:m.833031 g.833031  ORF g.833031 m.833031 type:complete len:153 (+) comp59465_c0_seq31:2542-3000(+)